MTTPDVQPDVTWQQVLGLSLRRSEPETSNNRRVIGCRQNALHRTVSLRQPRLLFVSN